MHHRSAPKVWNQLIDNADVCYTANCTWFLISNHLLQPSSPKSYHRRTVSCLAVASHHEHYNHPSYYIVNTRLCDVFEVADSSASPTRQTRHGKRKSEGAISLEQLQKGLTGASVAHVDNSEAKDKNEFRSSSGKLVKVWSNSINCITPLCTLPFLQWVT